MAYNYSPTQRFGNGVISGSFVTKHKSPIRFKVMNVKLPLGMQSFDGKWSALVSLDKQVPEISELYEDVKKFYGPQFEITNPVRTTDYGDQIKVKIDDKSNFFDSKGTLLNKDFLWVDDKTKLQFYKGKYVHLYLEVGMVWFRKSEGGITLKVVQMKEIIQSDDSSEDASCLI